MRLAQRVKDRRARRSFQPTLGEWSGLRLEPRALAAPVYTLNSPYPGIQSTASGPNVPLLVSQDFANGTENTSATAADADPRRWGPASAAVASYSGQATNQLISPSTTSMQPGIDVNVNLTNSFSVTAPDPRVTPAIYDIITTAESGTLVPTGVLDGTPSNTGQWIGWTFNDNTFSNNPFHAWGRPVTLTSNISISYTPMPAGLPRADFNTTVYFEAASAGILVRGPVADPITGRTALEVSKPIPGWPPGYPGGIQRTYYTDFFTAGQAINVTSVNQGNFNGESIRYAFYHGSDFTTSNGVGNGLSTLHFHFDESVSA